MPDEMRGDLVGNPNIQLPNLDALREDGVTFEQAYVTNPVCGPSRCCTFTGQYPQNGGHRSLYQLLRPHEQNIFRLCKEDGYYVRYIGRSDLFSPETERLSVSKRTGTFEETLVKQIKNAIELNPDLAPETRQELEKLIAQGNLAPGILESFPEIKHNVVSSMKSTWPSGHLHEKSFYNGKIEPDQVENELDHECIRQALEFLDNPPQEPFVLYIGLLFPHPPYQVEEPYFSMYDRKKVLLPVQSSLEDKPEFMRMIHNRYGLNKFSEDDFREIVATYYGMTSRVDTQLGTVVNKLREKKLYDNTAFFFFSDHGDYVGDYGLTEKWPVGFQDCLLRVPLVIKMPGQIGSGSKTDALTEMIDLFPTVLELANIKTDYTHFGKSLLPLINGKSKIHREAVFAAGGYNPQEPQCFEGSMPGTFYDEKMQIAKDSRETVSRAAMIRTRYHKLVIRSSGKEELYDLKKDPQETKNLIDDPNYALIQSDLRYRMLKWFLETSDNPHWERIRVM